MKRTFIFRCSVKAILQIEIRSGFGSLTPSIALMGCDCKYLCTWCLLISVSGYQVCNMTSDDWEPWLRAAANENIFIHSLIPSQYKLLADKADLLCVFVVVSPTVIIQRNRSHLFGTLKCIEIENHKEILITNWISNFAYQVRDDNPVWLIKNNKQIYAMDNRQVHFRCTKWSFEYQKNIFVKRNESEKKHIQEPIKNFKQIFWLP